jgi:hypothetical protein
MLQMEQLDFYCIYNVTDGTARFINVFIMLQMEQLDLYCTIYNVTDGTVTRAW